MTHRHCDACFDAACSSSPSVCQMVSCNHCGVPLHACKLSDHTSTVCRRRPTRCLNASLGCPEVIAFDRLSDHMAHCPAYVVTCFNKKHPHCSSLIRLSDWRSHGDLVHAPEPEMLTRPCPLQCPLVVTGRTVPEETNSFSQPPIVPEGSSPLHDDLPMTIILHILDLCDPQGAIALITSCRRFWAAREEPRVLAKTRVCVHAWEGVPMTEEEREEHRAKYAPRRKSPKFPYRPPRYTGYTHTLTWVAATTPVGVIGEGVDLANAKILPSEDWSTMSNFIGKHLQRCNNFLSVCPYSWNGCPEQELPDARAHAACCTYAFNPSYSSSTNDIVVNYRKVIQGVVTKTERTRNLEAQIHRRCAPPPPPPPPPLF